jgi:hypothetical protein
LGDAVPIYRLLEREAFEPEEVALMSNVFEELLQTLGLADQREDPVATRGNSLARAKMANTNRRYPRNSRN